MTDNLNSVDALSHYYFILLPKFFCQIKKEKMIDNKLYQRFRHYQLFDFFLFANDYCMGAFNNYINNKE